MIVVRLNLLSIGHECGHSDCHEWCFSYCNSDSEFFIIKFWKEMRPKRCWKTKYGFIKLFVIFVTFLDHKYSLEVKHDKAKPMLSNILQCSFKSQKHTMKTFYEPHIYLFFYFLTVFSVMNLIIGNQYFRSQSDLDFTLIAAIGFLKCWQYEIIRNIDIHIWNIICDIYMFIYIYIYVYVCILMCVVYIQTERQTFFVRFN